MHEGGKEHTNMTPKNKICLWFDKDAHEAARFYAATFPDSKVTADHKAPGDYPSGKQGDVLTVEFIVLSIPVSVSTAARSSATTRPFPSRSRRTVRKRRIATGTRSSATAARKASAAGARIGGASPGRSPRAR
jgi:hypothetical protein